MSTQASNPQKGTLYIVPAWSDQAGQCRIVGIEQVVPNAAVSYRTQPSIWLDVGVMNSRGDLVCLAPRFGGAGGFQMLQDSQPLMAGTQWEVELAESVDKTHAL